MTSTLKDKIADFTVRPGRPAIRRATEPEIVVVVPFRANLGAGFKRARALGPRPVRLIGHGATLPGTWPAWVKSSEGLTITELGAYRTHVACEPSEPIRRALTRWTDRIFGGLGDGLRGFDALYSTAANRLLTYTMDLRGVAEGIAEYHGRQKIEIVGRPWQDLEQALDRRVPVVDTAARVARRVAWPACFGAAWSLALGGTVWREIESYRASSASRANLRATRKQPPPNAHGDVWVALIPDWVRVNRHVIDSIALPALRQGRLRGILLSESLSDGLRTETKLATEASDTLWPGLAQLNESLGKLEVDQLVRSETIREFALDLAHTMRASANAAVRLAVSGPAIPESARHEHDLFGQLWNVAALCTLDVARVVAAQRATQRAVKRRSFAGAQIFFPSCASASSAAACAVMNLTGATTIDFFHGAGIEHAHGSVEGPAQMHGTWTKLDADAFEAVGRTALEVGMSVRVRPNGARAGKRILIMSNYAHRDELWPYSLPFQDELLRITKLAPPGYEFRWRPHPADDPQRIAGTLRGLTGVQLSKNARLEDDIAWASVIVSSMSSAVIEALFAGVPAFVHMPPHYDGLGVFSFVARERVFFRAEELWPRLSDTVAAMERGVDTSGPEMAARHSLFGGPPGQPASFDFERRTPHKTSIFP